jgi:hypothetical protein
MKVGVAGSKESNDCLVTVNGSYEYFCNCRRQRGA